MAREHPQGEGGCHSTSQNAGNSVVGEAPRHQESDTPDVCAVEDKSSSDEFELSNSAPDFGNDIRSCIEHANVEKSNHLVGPDVPFSSRSSVSSQRRQRRQMAAARRKASVLSLSDTSDQLYTLVDGVKGHVDGQGGIAALCSVRDRLNVCRRVHSGLRQATYPIWWYLDPI